MQKGGVLNHSIKTKKDSLFSLLVVYFTVDTIPHLKHAVIIGTRLANSRLQLGKPIDHLYRTW